MVGVCVLLQTAAYSLIYVPEEINTQSTARRPSQWLPTTTDSTNGTSGGSAVRNNFREMCTISLDFRNAFLKGSYPIESEVALKKAMSSERLTVD